MKICNKKYIYICGKIVLKERESGPLGCRQGTEYSRIEDNCIFFLWLIWGDRKTALPPGRLDVVVVRGLASCFCLSSGSSLIGCLCGVLELIGL